MMLRRRMRRGVPNSLMLSEEVRIDILQTFVQHAFILNIYLKSNTLFTFVSDHLFLFRWFWKIRSYGRYLLCLWWLISCNWSLCFFPCRSFLLGLSYISYLINTAQWRMFYHSSLILLLLASHLSSCNRLIYRSRIVLIYRPSLILLTSSRRALQSVFLKFLSDLHTII